MYDRSVERVLHAQAARAESVVLRVVAGGTLEGRDRVVGLALVVVGVDDECEGVVPLVGTIDLVDDALGSQKELRREYVTEHGPQLRDQTR